jgi:uncharacterized repeat protein (TIGR01451 family)
MKTPNQGLRNHARTYALAALFSALAAVKAANADMLVVTSLADDGSPGTLRAALAAANDGDTIDATGISGTILLTAGELLVDDSVAILGPGAASLSVDANHLGRVFQVTAGRTASIDGLTISNGMGGRGGAILTGASSLTVSNCTLSGNTAARGGGIFNDGFNSGGATLIVIASNLRGNSASFYGGGIFNDGRLASASTTVTVTNSTISGNTTVENGGGIYNDGDGGNATLTVVDGKLTGNSAENGGGIFNNGGGSGSATLTLTNSTLSANSAVEDGGGIHNASSISGIATVTVDFSTLNGNSAAFGGGIYNKPRDDGDTALWVSNSTLSGNSAFKGGGIYNEGNEGSTNAKVANCTFSDNFAITPDSSGSIHNTTGTGSDTMDIGNTILMVNPSSRNLSGAFISRGFNLRSDNGGGDLTAASDQIEVDPLLGPLADNGGPTFTHLPLPGSPAIDKGEANTVPLLSSDTDQRGFARTVDDLSIPNAFLGDGTDIGAVEVAVAPPPPVVEADLLVSLGVDKVAVKQGELLTYTITVLNFGPDTAANVVVNDTLSTGTTFVSAHANKGSFTAPPKNQTGVVTWSLGDMENGDTEAAELVVTVIVKGKTTVTNTASAASDSDDPNPANNVAAITTSVGSGSTGGGKKK